MLLLCSTLGEEDSRPLSYAQFQALSDQIRAFGRGEADMGRDLTERDLTRLGQSREAAARIVALLGREARLAEYLAAGERQSIFPLTRITPGYPTGLRETLGKRCPPVLYYRGDLRLLKLPCVSVVGSRKPDARAIAFARRCGELAARENFALCTGGAPGVDAEAERACLRLGGCVIEFPAGRLSECRQDARVLYLAESAYDAPFSAQRALTRNRFIHAISARTYAAQPRLRQGGTWHGCVDNLRGGFSTLYVYNDESAGARALGELGAELIDLPDTLLPGIGQLRFRDLKG